MHMRKHYVRELRKIDSTSYGVTLPKNAVLEEIKNEEEEGEQVEHENAHVGIELSKTEEGNIVFEIELVSGSDNQSGLEDFN